MERRIHTLCVRDSPANFVRGAHELGLSASVRNGEKHAPSAREESARSMFQLREHDSLRVRQSSPTYVILFITIPDNL